MDPRAEFEALLIGLLDGPPDPDRSRRLRDLLHRHPELRSEYLDHLQLHGLLQWRGGPALVPARPPRRAWFCRAALVAAALAAAIALLLLTPPAEPGPDVIRHMTDWNLSLSRADVPEARREIYQTHVSTMTALLAALGLPPDDRALAEALYENGAWLAINNDPVAEADRFSDLADRFVASIVAAGASPRATLLADAYARFDGGVAVSLERARLAAARDPEKVTKFDRAFAGHAKRNKRLADLMERGPEPHRKAMYRALKGHTRKKHPPFQPK